MRSFFEFKKSAGAGHCGGCFCAWIDSLVHVHRSAGVLMLWHCIWLGKVPECKEEKRRCIIYSYLAADLVLLMTDLSKWELQNLHAGPCFYFWNLLWHRGARPFQNLDNDGLHKPPEHVMKASNLWFTCYLCFLFGSRADLSTGAKLNRIQNDSKRFDMVQNQSYVQV